MLENMQGIALIVHNLVQKVFFTVIRDDRGTKTTSTFGECIMNHNS